MPILGDTRYRVLGEFSSDRPGCSDPNATHRPWKTAVDRRYEKVVAEMWTVSVNPPIR